MADDAQSPYYNFYRPEMRGQLSIKNLHIPKKLLKTIKKFPYEITINQDFKGVIDGCAAERKGNQGTWINNTIRNVFIELHKMGYAHSIEARLNGDLVGGLYGLALGAVFCGESMFSTQTDASKTALVHLCARLSAGGFTVLDTQFTNEHLEQFGIYEIPQEEYEDLIKTEMKKSSDFYLKNKNEKEIIENYLS